MSRVSDVMVAFLRGKSRTVKAHETDGQTYWLHGHPVIRKDKRTYIIDCCGWPTRTTFAVLNQITRVDGLHYSRDHAEYKKLSICGRGWNGEAAKLKMADVQISRGLPGAKPFNKVCESCSLYTGDAC